jgi:hypothetical protein
MRSLYIFLIAGTIYTFPLKGRSQVAETSGNCGHIVISAALRKGQVDSIRSELAKKGIHLTIETLLYNDRQKIGTFKGVVSYKHQSVNFSAEKFSELVIDAQKELVVTVESSE